MKRSSEQLVQLADKLIEHGFNNGLIFSEAKLKSIQQKAIKLLSAANDAGLGSPHGAANRSKYGYMALECVDIPNRRIIIDDYHDWSLQWVDRNTLRDPYEDMQINWEDYEFCVNKEGSGVYAPCVRDLLAKLRPPA